MQSGLIIPQSVRAVLWSYDPELLDIAHHKRVIISQVLNFGTKDALQWLFQTYTKNEITTEANIIPLGQWDKKSLCLWKLVLGINPISKMQKMGAL